MGFVAETLSVRRVEKAAKLGRWEQIMKHLDIVRSQNFILWTTRSMGAVGGQWLLRWPWI